MVFICFFCLFASSVFLNKLYEERMEGLNKGNIILIIPLVLFFGIGCYSVIAFFKKVPAIYFDEKLLKVKKETYKWNDITSININSKDHFYYWAKSEVATIKIEFFDKKSLIIYKSMYSNLNEIEEFVNKLNK